jgi:hypothetical protein
MEADDAAAVQIAVTVADLHDIRRPSHGRRDRCCPRLPRRERGEPAFGEDLDIGAQFTTIGL